MLVAYFNYVHELKSLIYLDLFVTRKE